MAKNVEVDNLIKKQQVMERAIAGNSAVIAKIDKEILEARKQNVGKKVREDTKTRDEGIVIDSKKCRHHNQGYCKHELRCRYTHPSKVCEEHIKSQKCKNNNCVDIHL